MSLSCRAVPASGRTKITVHIYNTRGRKSVEYERNRQTREAPDRCPSFGYGAPRNGPTPAPTKIDGRRRHHRPSNVMGAPIAR